MLFSWLKAIYNVVEIGERLDRKRSEIFLCRFKLWFIWSGWKIEENFFNQYISSVSNKSTKIKTNKFEISVARVKTQHTTVKTSSFSTKRNKKILPCKHPHTKSPRAHHREIFLHVPQIRGIFGWVFENFPCSLLSSL
jgi:hypothetical protein